jgi:hypothetical protein
MRIIGDLQLTRSAGSRLCRALCEDRRWVEHAEQSGMLT